MVGSVRRGRPIYESAESLRQEALVARFLEAKWRCLLVKRPGERPQIDFDAFRPLVCADQNLQAFIEVKGRNYTSIRLHELRGLKLAVHKFEAGRTLSQEAKRAFVLVLNLPDGLFFQTYLHDWPSYARVWGGRKDRGDPLDEEWCYLIPMAGFQRFPDDDAYAALRHALTHP